MQEESNPKIKGPFHDFSSYAVSLAYAVIHLIFNTPQWNVAVKSLSFDSASARSELKLLFLFAAYAWMPVVFSPTFTTENMLRHNAANVISLSLQYDTYFMSLLLRS